VDVADTKPTVWGYSTIEIRNQREMQAIAIKYADFWALGINSESCYPHMMNKW